MRGDFLLALGIILILMFMLVPMPAWLLDAGLAVSITFLDGTPPRPRPRVDTAYSFERA